MGESTHSPICSSSRFARGCVRAMWPLLRIAIRASDAKQLRLLRATLEDA